MMQTLSFLWPWLAQQPQTLPAAGGEAADVPTLGELGLWLLISLALAWPLLRLFKPWSWWRCVYVGPEQQAFSLPGTVVRHPRGDESVQLPIGLGGALLLLGLVFVVCDLVNGILLQSFWPGNLMEVLSRYPGVLYLLGAMRVFWLAVALVWFAYGVRAPIWAYLLGSTDGRPRPFLRNAGFGLALMAISLPAVILASQGWVWLLWQLDGVVPAGQELVDLLGGTSDPLLWSAAIFTAALVAPVAEETVFRGFLYPALRIHLPGWAALVVQAGLFAAIHANLAATVPLFLLGIVLAMGYERTRSIWTPIAMHAGFNAFTLVQLALTGK